VLTDAIGFDFVGFDLIGVDLVAVVPVCVLLVNVDLVCVILANVDLISFDPLSRTLSAPPASSRPLLKISQAQAIGIIATNKATVRRYPKASSCALSMRLDIKVGIPR